MTIRKLLRILAKPLPVLAILGVITPSAWAQFGGFGNRFGNGNNGGGGLTIIPGGGGGGGYGGGNRQNPLAGILNGGNTGRMQFNNGMNNNNNNGLGGLFRSNEPEYTYPNNGYGPNYGNNNNVPRAYTPAPTAPAAVAPTTHTLMIDLNHPQRRVYVAETRRYVEPPQYGDANNRVVSTPYPQTVAPVVKPVTPAPVATAPTVAPTPKPTTSTTTTTALPPPTVVTPAPEAMPRAQPARRTAAPNNVLVTQIPPASPAERAQLAREVQERLESLEKTRAGRAGVEADQTQAIAAELAALRDDLRHAPGIDGIALGGVMADRSFRVVRSASYAGPTVALDERTLLLEAGPEKLTVATAPASRIGLPILGPSGPAAATASAPVKDAPSAASGLSFFVPADAGADVRVFVLSLENTVIPVVIRPGTIQSVPNRTAAKIAYHDGLVNTEWKDFAAGDYEFTRVNGRWRLGPRAFTITLDNNANAGPFQYRIDGVAGSVPPRRIVTLPLAKPTTVIEFSRGNGQTAARLLTAGPVRYAVRLDSESQGLDLFSNNAPLDDTAPAFARGNEVAAPVSAIEENASTTTARRSSTRLAPLPRPRPPKRP